MANGSGEIKLAITAKKNPKLLALKCFPWVFEVVVPVLLWTDDEPSRHQPFDFCLDTKSDVSTIPATWIHRPENRPAVGKLSMLLQQSTTAGKDSASGRMTKKIAAQVHGYPQELLIEFLVAEKWQSDKGLLALRDILRYFDIRTEGAKFDETGTPKRPGYLVLLPRST